MTRSVRFCIDHRGVAALDERQSNTFAAWPTLSGMGRYYELDVTCTGDPDPTTGYFMNIKAIDEAVRQSVLPELIRRIAADSDAVVGDLLPDALSRLTRSLEGHVHSITWRLTPYLLASMESHNMTTTIIRQQFAFAASHRLHSPELSDEENRRIFGKCNNRNGHGHNYRLEVAVEVPVETPRGRPFSLPELERTVDESVIERFDHKNLNTDCAEFTYLNPSVENIARVCFDLLAGPLGQSGTPLREVTVWETEKTSCTYPG